MTNILNPVRLMHGRRFHAEAQRARRHSSSAGERGVLRSLSTASPTPPLRALDGGEPFFKSRADIFVLKLRELACFDEQVGLASFHIFDIERLVRMCRDGC